ncbi:MAG: hypothetical protein IJH63_10355 [Methanobrevibacter sp.]|nr:hypothetical protein [Methanosphaera sp.]MBR0371101.1 hypothetical protein [Methanobrevibacter sp.]
MVLLKDLINETKKEPKKKKKKRRPKKRKTKVLENTQTGFYAVYKMNCHRCTNGYYWKYDDGLNVFNNVDFMKLRLKVKESGLKWSVTNINYALRTSRLTDYPIIYLK